MKNDKETVFTVAAKTIRERLLRTVLLAVVILGSIVAGLLPPLVLERMVNLLAGGGGFVLHLALLYFLFTAAAGLFDSAREVMITIFGQKITHGLRSAMCAKLERLPSSYFVTNEPGTVTSRFVNDADTVEALFTSGIIGMLVDVCRIVSILAIIFVKSQGLGILILAAAPFLFLMTRRFQKNMLAAQLENRAAVAKAGGHIPETIHSIRMIHTYQKEKFMENRYGNYIEESYRSVEKSNFYDAVYSPIIVTVSAVIVAVMMILSARGGGMQTFFGMSVGTAVAVTAYVGKVFGPLENIGMEIQSIQSAVAGIVRINEFLAEPEIEKAEEGSKGSSLAEGQDIPAIELRNITFGYEKNKEVVHDFSLSLKQGDQVTLTGRTGAGKSTIFRLILGLFEPWSGTVRIQGMSSGQIPEEERRRIFGYVEQTFHPVPGTVLEQITLNDPKISREDAERAAALTGLDEILKSLEKGYDTSFTAELFSQGQLQLLSIARAIAANPKILLLDEITANLDSATEEMVLNALTRASCERTVLSISHRLYEKSGGRRIEI